MSARSSPRSVSLRCTALALAALSGLAACSRQSAPAAAAPVAMQPAPTAVATQAPVPSAVQAPAYAGASSYVNESTDPNAPVHGNGPGDADDGQQQVVSVYVDPPLEQPAPIAVDWAPPPMLVEEVAPQPFADAIWTGGYWAWQGRWVWSAGRWSRPPRPDYRWHQPYYEHRADKVVYVPAYWSPPERPFVAPAVGVAIAAGVVAPGVHAGHHAEGPQGVFIPPPPAPARGAQPAAEQQRLLAQQQQDQAQRAERAQIQRTAPDDRRPPPEQAEQAQQQVQHLQQEQQQRAQQAQQRAQQDQQRAQQEQAALANEARAQAERARAETQRRAPGPRPEDAERK